MDEERGKGRGETGQREERKEKSEKSSRAEQPARERTSARAATTTKGLFAPLLAGPFQQHQLACTLQEFWKFWASNPQPIIPT